MRISLGFSAALTPVLHRTATISAAKTMVGRELLVIGTSTHWGRGRASQGAKEATDGGGVLARPQLGGGRPRALAAFVERPQAARSNRRYHYPIGAYSMARQWKENYKYLRFGESDALNCPPAGIERLCRPPPWSG